MFTSNLTLSQFSLTFRFARADVCDIPIKRDLLSHFCLLVLFEMGRACSTNGERRNVYRILVGNPEGRRSLGRPRRRWVDNIKMDLKEVGWDGRDWIDLAQDRDRRRAYVNAVMNLRLP
jgi:hypothetical protein